MTIVGWVSERARRQGYLAGGHYSIGVVSNFDRADVTAGTGTTIWSEKTQFPWSLAAAPIDLVSTSALDNVGGAGAWSVQLSGIGADLSGQKEVVELDGLTPVQTAKSFHRINRIDVAQVGSTGCNQGGITLSNAGTTVAVVGACKGRANRGLFTVPYEWRTGGLFTRIWGNIADSQSASGVIALRVRDAPELAWIEIGVLGVSSGGGVNDFVLQTSATLPPGADVEVVVTELDRDNVGITAGFDIIRLS